MNKDYKKWIHTKVILNNSDKKQLFFHEREVWYCHLGENIGFEQDGAGELFLRPIVIIRKFNNSIFWIIPLTRTNKNTSFYFQFYIETNNEKQEKKSTAILSQIRLTDAKRLRRHIGYINKKDFLELKQNLKALLP